MYKTILDALKAKFQGVSDTILNRIATKLAKTVTTAEQVQPAVDAMTLQQVIDSYADSRATEATQTAVHNYETRYGLKEGKPVTNPQPTPPTPQPPTPQPKPQGGDDQTVALLNQLIESNKALKERLDSFDKDRTTATRKQQISDIISKLPDSVRKPYERISLDSLSDDDFTSLKGEITTEVDSLVKDLGSKGVVFGRPAPHGGQPNNPNALTKEQEAAIAVRTASPTAEGQPF